jgi:hypothetical protein
MVRKRKINQQKWHHIHKRIRVFPLSFLVYEGYETKDFHRKEDSTWPSMSYLETKPSHQSFIVGISNPARECCDLFTPVCNFKRPHSYCENRLCFTQSFQPFLAQVTV